MSERAQSTLIGIVLLLGMVAIGSLGIFLVASDMLTDVEQESEHDRVENSFVELSQQMATASSDGDVSRSMDIDVGEDGAVVMSDTGNLTIQGGNVSETISIGAIEYTDDGTKIAYQAGGVFRETGNQTRVVSAPPVNYDNESDTLSFPIIKTRDESHIDSGNVYMSYHDTDPHHDADHVVNDTVTIGVESEYYRGWEQYFVDEIGESAIQNVTTLEGDKGYVEVELGLQDLDNAYDKAVGHSEDGLDDETGPPHAGVDEDDADIHDFEPIDDLVKSRIEDAQDKDPIDLEGKELKAGLHYSTGEILRDDLTFNLSEGDITLAVDGDLEFDGQTVSVTNPEGGEVYIYTNKSVFVNNANVNTNSEDAAAPDFQVYGTSESYFWYRGGETVYRGTFFAPGSPSADPDPKSHPFDNCGIEYDVCTGHGNPSLKGSVIADRILLQQASDVSHDPALETYNPDLYPDGIVKPPEITYLNIAEYKVDVRSN